MSEHDEVVTPKKTATVKSTKRTFVPHDKLSTVEKWTWARGHLLMVHYKGGGKPSVSTFTLAQLIASDIAKEVT